MTEAQLNSTTDTSAVIDIQNVSHAYKKGVPILEDVNLTLGTGFFGLLGANGAGKSTLMRIICTLLKPTSGTARVLGFDVVNECMEVRKRIGYLPQEFSAWRLHRTEEVLDTLARISGLTNGKQRRARIAEVLELVGLDEVAQRKVKKLSGGMVRRLGVAQALVHEPDVIVVDEPTVGLDPEERMRFRQLMVELGQSRTILLSTHIVADLGAGCNEIALLDDHKIAFRGSPTDFLYNAKGYVFKVTMDRSQADEFESSFEIVAREALGDQTSYRFVVEDPAEKPANAEVVDEPTLEEAYLAFMAARGKLESARQDEDENE